MALRDLHRRYGHIQEIIIQNFCAKPDTRMAQAPEPDADDHLWTIAVARILFGPAMNIQAPPNLSGGPLADMIAAGINDWGGVSPVTPDHVNPEKPWPALDALARRTAEAGKVLVERLAVYPPYIRDAETWLDASLARAGAARVRRGRLCAHRRLDCRCWPCAAISPLVLAKAGTQSRGLGHCSPGSPLARG